MPDWSKGKGQAKCISLSTRLMVGRGANYDNPGKSYCYETTEESKTQVSRVGKDLEAYGKHKMKAIFKLILVLNLSPNIFNRVIILCVEF
jgi:hypothetical protein